MNTPDWLDTCPKYRIRKLARRLTTFPRNIPAWIDRRLAARCDLGGGDD